MLLMLVECLVKAMKNKCLQNYEIFFCYSNRVNLRYNILLQQHKPPREEVLVILNKKKKKKKNEMK